MSSQPYFTLSIPKKMEDMVDFVAVLKRVLEQLFQQTHFHLLTRTTAPASTDGKPGDLYIITVGGTDYLYAKTLAGTWKRATLS